MNRDLRPWINAGESGLIKWQRIMSSLFAGYITSDEAANIATELLLNEEDEDFKHAAKEHVTPDELIFETTEDAFIRHFILEYDMALKYKPDCRKSIWGYKDIPDNSFGVVTPNDPDLFGLYVLEEFGFIRVGNMMVSRTVQPIWLKDKNKIMRDVVVALPYIEEDKLSKFLNPRLAIGGGLQFFGVFKMKQPSTYLSQELKCDATAVLLYVGTPREYGIIYPFDLINIPPQEYEKEIYV